MRILLIALLAALFSASPARAQPSVAATDPAAQVKLGDDYFYGRGVKQSYKDARVWYQKAADLKQVEAMRRLGEMYARGLGGKKDKAKALDVWIAGERLGDPLTAVLVADLYYQDITGEKDPAPGRFKFTGGVPGARIDDAIAWYEAARDRDPRPEVKTRAELALYVLSALKSADGVKVTR